MIRMLCAVLVLMFTSNAVAGDTFLTWKDSSGKVYYTDALDTVPSQYRDSVTETKWSAEMKSDKKRTVSSTPRPHARPRIVEHSLREESQCGLPYSRNLVWVTKGEYTRRMIHVYDSCGNLLDEDFSGSRR